MNDEQTPKEVPEDVEGHKIRHGIETPDTDETASEDVEGHKIRHGIETSDEDDTEGHLRPKGS